MTSQNSRRHIHFFKVIIERTIRDEKLMIPTSFVEQYGKELSNTIMLKLPNGDKWKVHLTKSDRNDMWLEKGWKKFRKHYSLDYGHFLVFKYEGGSQFQILILHPSGLEIDYPTSESSTNDEEETNISHEEQKTNPGRRGSVKGKIWSKSECNGRKETHEGNKASEKAKKFKSEYPFFIRQLSASYVKHLLFLPRAFSKRYMKGLEQEQEGNATLYVREEESEDKGEPWSVSLKFRKIDNRISVTTGWKSIREKYKLKEGDACVFEMVQSCHTNFSFKVIIFRNTQEPSSEQFQDCESPNVSRGK
ncbi:hypothetical protein Fmac_001920 [Flemingia macrophylla]|uniref:TF-B3 domain-containing protein n=1 Tax=Flemingia macrophylla TaxID=520843 RepID=A0ABD1NIH1_9FABA